MSAAEDVKFPLRVLINKQQTKVLFAEIDSDFADVLLSFLTLPLGRIVKLFRGHYGDQAPIVGSLNTLYNGLENLDDVHFWSKGGKQMLLNPVNSLGDFCRKLKLNLDDSQPPKYFICENPCSGLSCTMYYGSVTCSNCGGSICKEINIRENSNIGAARSDTGEVFTKKTTDFTISDDLQTVPNVSGFLMQTLSNFGITDTDGTEQRTVHFGLNEIMNLLKGLLLSRTPLTDLILNKTQMEPFREMYEAGPSLDQIVDKEATPPQFKIVVKTTLQKSTNEILFVQARHDFVEFLFSLLTIPLGGVAHLLGGSTSLRNVDNLYRSIASFDGEHLANGQCAKIVSLMLRLPPMYLSTPHILRLRQPMEPTLYYCRDKYTEYLSSAGSGREVGMCDPKGEDCYVRRPGMFMVTDDLTATPFSTLSTVSLLNKMKIPVSDVKELELEIGRLEALRILKASLTATAVLTHALKPLLQRQPKKNKDSDRPGCSSMLVLRSPLALVDCDNFRMHVLAFCLICQL